MKYLILIVMIAVTSACVDSKAPVFTPKVTFDLISCDILGCKPLSLRLKEEECFRLARSLATLSKAQKRKPTKVLACVES